VYIAVPLADLAQLVERLIRNQQVAGSSPAVGSFSSSAAKRACAMMMIRWL
jgi:hypothetical protein